MLLCRGMMAMMAILFLQRVLPCMVRTHLSDSWWRANLRISDAFWSHVRLKITYVEITGSFCSLPRIANWGMVAGPITSPLLVRGGGSRAAFYHRFILFLWMIGILAARCWWFAGTLLDLLFGDPRPAGTTTPLAHAGERGMRVGDCVTPAAE